MNNSEIENKNANPDVSSEALHSAACEMDAREQMVAARREQQRLHILRNLHSSRR